MCQLFRREFPNATAAAGALLRGATRSPDEAVGPVRIAGVGSFRDRVPISKENLAAARMTSCHVARIDHDWQNR